jgi:hypothetical protein
MKADKKDMGFMILPWGDSALGPWQEQLGCGVPLRISQRVTSRQYSKIFWAESSGVVFPFVSCWMTGPMSSQYGEP